MGFWEQVGHTFNPGNNKGLPGSFWSDNKGLPGIFWNDITGQTAADKAADAQSKGVDASLEATQLALDQQMEMFNQNQEMLAPFINQAEGAMGQMGALTGMEGAAQQQAAYDAIQNSPMFQSQVQQGESALLQNAAATGGLRGGNTQGALAQFRPQMLQNAINQQYSQLGGIANLGMGPVSQSSAGFGQAAGAQGQTGAQTANLLTQGANAQAGNHLAQYQLGRDFAFDLAGLGVKAAGLI